MINIEKINRITEDDIIEYFKDTGREWFDCGEGYYQEEATLYAQLDSGNIYEINMEAICEGNKTDYGDRIYFVDEITKVTFKEVSETCLIEKQLEELEGAKLKAMQKFEDICKMISQLEDRKLDLENEGK